MKKVLLIALVVVVGIALVRAAVIRKSMNQRVAELPDMGIEISRPLKSSTTTVKATGLPWTLYQTACIKGGYYGILLYTGRTVTLTEYPTSSVYVTESRSGPSDPEPVTAWVLSSGDRVICVYYAVKDLIPGILPIDDPFVKPAP